MGRVIDELDISIISIRQILYRKFAYESISVQITYLYKRIYTKGSLKDFIHDIYSRHNFLSLTQISDIYYARQFINRFHYARDRLIKINFYRFTPFERCERVVSKN